VALRLDRAAGGWTGRLAVSERDGAGVAALAYERLGDALPTVSWVSLSPGVRAVLPLLVRRAGPLAGMLPEAGDAPGYAALLRTNPADAGSPPALAYVQRVDAGDGPARFDAAVAAALRSAQPGGDGPDHEGRYPGAVRVQPVEALPWPGSGARVVWGYSEPDGPTRTAAMVITPPHDAAGTGAAESSLRALLAAGGERPVEGAAVTTGSLRLAELQALHRALVAPVGEPGPILSRIESVWWSLTRSEIGGRPALLGPVSVTLTPSRQGVLGTK